jgi:IS5 family transposase
MLKMLVLQALYNLSDDQTEFQVRARVEHVFGDQRTRQGSTLVQTKGKVRAAVKIGLMNLTFNMRRLEFLLRPQAACCMG